MSSNNDESQTAAELYRPSYENTGSLGTITLPLCWHFFDPPGQSYNRIWSLQAGHTNMGEVWRFGVDEYAWRMNGIDFDVEGHCATRDEAQAALLAEVRKHAI